jgi:hypothetical protein
VKRARGRVPEGRGLRKPVRTIQGQAAEFRAKEGNPLLGHQWQEPCGSPQRKARVRGKKKRMWKIQSFQGIQAVPQMKAGLATRLCSEQTEGFMEAGGIRLRVRYGMNMDGFVGW